MYTKLQSQLWNPDKTIFFINEIILENLLSTYNTRFTMQINLFIWDLECRLNIGKV